MLEYPVINRCTMKVEFTAKINCEESEKDSIKKRLAVLWAIENGVELRFAKLSFANFRDADLSDVDLSDANFRYANFRHANFRYADFRYADFRYADFRDANFRGANFRGANFRDANFRGANFRGAKFPGSSLEGAILPDQYDVPVLEDIHGRMYDVCAGNGNLDMERFCGTAKCIAGWLCTLTGERGLALADGIGYDAAASLIYMASDPGLEVLPDYYGTNEEALRYLKRMVEKESGID